MSLFTLTCPFSADFESHAGIADLSEHGVYPHAGSPVHNQVAPFAGYLGAKNGANAQTYYFKAVQTKQMCGSYSQIMKDECAKIDMKPLCDHPTYCKNNADTIYIGQSHHMAHEDHRRNHYQYYPSGWPAIATKFPTRFCAYTDHHGGHDKALCTEGGSHAWLRPWQNNNFMCVSLTKPQIGESRTMRTSSIIHPHALP